MGGLHLSVKLQFNLASEYVRIECRCHMLIHVEYVAIAYCILLHFVFTCSLVSIHPYWSMLFNVHGHLYIQAASLCMIHPDDYVTISR